MEGVRLRSVSPVGKGLLLGHVRAWPAGQVEPRQAPGTAGLAGIGDCVPPNPRGGSGRAGCISAGLLNQPLNSRLGRLRKGPYASEIPERGRDPKMLVMLYRHIFLGALENSLLNLGAQEGRVAQSAVNKSVILNLFVFSIMDPF